MLPGIILGPCSAMVRIAGKYTHASSQKKGNVSASNFSKTKATISTPKRAWYILGFNVFSTITILRLLVEVLIRFHPT